MYKATILKVEKNTDSIKYEVNFTNGIESYVKNYDFVMVADIERSFDETIQHELKRINDLEEMYSTLKAKEGTIIEMGV